jgi:site-specific DNA-cytosine methylase
MLRRSGTPTYISLFSSAGVGCYGFKMEGFECIATNEIIERRLEVQKANNKCKFGSSYIFGNRLEHHSNCGQGNESNGREISREYKPYCAIY